MLKTIARTAALAVLAGGLNLAVGTPAIAQAPGSSVANGRRCTFNSITDPNGEAETQVGQINAGPLAAADTGASIQITCTIQVGGANATHAGADADSVTSTVGTQVASIPPTEDDQPPTINYVAPENVPVFLCTEGALCNEAISQEIFPGPFQPVLDILVPILDSLFLLLDETLAPVFDLLIDLEVAYVDPVVCDVLDNALDGSALDAYPFRIGDDGDPDDGDLYYDFSGDNAFGDDEWVWDCPAYRW
jgi:hypothetical protein